jgi:hypothetical protein
MNKQKLLIYVVIAVVLVIALLRGIFLGDPADMRMEASGL